MLELICNQQYTWDGLPVDRSPYRNHGQAVHTVGYADGWEPGSGVVTFPQPNSRVLIQSGGPWQQLTALRVEVVARVANPLLPRVSVLVAGDGAFHFGLMEGALEAHFVNSSGRNDYVRSADQYAPDHEYHPVPANRWVKLGLFHDGFAKMRLFMDDELVGEATIDGSVPPVRTLGVSIGNDVSQDGNQFPGEIDEVSVWRLDPTAVKREFLGRPYTKETADCWAKHAEKVNAWKAENPEQHRSLVRHVNTAGYSFNRALYLLPDSDQAKLNAALDGIAALWFRGQLDGPEMRTTLCQWITLLRSFGLNVPDGFLTGDLVAAFDEVGVDLSDLLACDPQFATLVKYMDEAMAGCTPSKEER